MNQHGQIIANTILVCLALGSWATAFFSDILSDRAVWAVIDLLIPPIGMVRGVMMWLGFI